MARSYRVPCQSRAAGAASPRTGGCASSVETPGTQCTYNKNVMGVYKIVFFYHVHYMCVPWTRLRHREHGKIGRYWGAEKWGGRNGEACNGEEGRWGEMRSVGYSGAETYVSSRTRLVHRERTRWEDPLCRSTSADKEVQGARGGRAESDTELMSIPPCLLFVRGAQQHPVRSQGTGTGTRHAKP